MMLQTVLEPIVLGFEPDQNARRTTMTRDDDLLGRREPEEPREVLRRAQPGGL